MDVAEFDNNEVSDLASALDSHGVASPLVDLSWAEAWRECLVTAFDVLEAAIDELGLR